MALTTGGNSEEVMSTINITPFTDVLLVLLIIFIILASVIKEPKLPDAHNKELVKESQIVVTSTTRTKSRSVQSSTRSRRSSPRSKICGVDEPSVQERHHQSRSEGQLRDDRSVMDKAKDVGLTSFGLANHVEGSKI